MTTLDTPLALAHGAPLPNRIAKAAMEEFLTDIGHLPGDRLERLYRRWSAGGAGLLITGHVMVDPQALADRRDVVLTDRAPLEPFQRWARAARSGGARAWMQINHPGRVITGPRARAWSASNVRVDAGRWSRLYPRPTPMSARQIEQTVRRFAVTAGLARDAGFDGVEVHAAHGYLLNQFLSPHTNRRTDNWGGTLENRARFLLDVVDAIRDRVGGGFSVAVKLNTADFQRGGFAEDDAHRVIGMLAQHGADLVELSGGSVESLAVHGHAADGRTLAREAYFLQAASEILADAPLPIMLTGGIRRRTAALRVLDGGAAVAGVATALAVDPTAPRRWLDGQDAPAGPVHIPWQDKTLAAAATLALVRHRLAEYGRGRDHPRPRGPLLALATDRLPLPRRPRGPGRRLWPTHVGRATGGHSAFPDGSSS